MLLYKFGFASSFSQQVRHSFGLILVVGISRICMFFCNELTMLQNCKVINVTNHRIDYDCFLAVRLMSGLIQKFMINCYLLLKFFST